MQDRALERRWKRAVPMLLLVLALLCVGGRLTADEAKEHFDKAVALYKQNKLNEAQSEFALARKAKPNEPTILFWIGFIDLQQQKYADALEPLEQGVKLKPDSAEGHLNLGNAYDGLKRYPDAIKEFETVSHLQPGNADAYYDLGSIYSKLKRYPDAVAAYRRAVALNPNDPYIQNDLGFALQATNDVVAAEDAYEKATKLQPDNATFWLNLGLAARSVARNAQSAPDEPPSPEAQAAWKKAGFALSRAVQLSPNNYAIREAYGETLFDVGHNDDASDQFEKAAQLDPKQFNPLYNLGLAQARMGHQAKAADAFRRALALQPDSREALSGLGTAQFQQGDYEGAAKTFTQLTKLAPDDATAWIDLGSSLQHQGDSVGAVSAMEEALKHVGKGPRTVAVRRALAASYLNKGDADSLKRAEETYLQVLQDVPEDPDALNGLGLIAQKRGKTEDAIGYFKRAIAVNSRFADAINNLAVAYEAKGDTDLAIKTYRRALQVDPKNAQAKKNLARFDKATNNTKPSSP
ncbi:MAG TPA: tetratricopeptide repeat protein [Chthonomonadaceae bacterium]|nr:tetratricopeptide repeat protein [Chthonomonadaceae bacterium]